MDKIVHESIRVQIWGDYALFTRPETKAERYTYDVITPSAARGILDAILYQKDMRWVIDKLYIQNPISHVSLRQNELMFPASSLKALSVYNGGSDEGFYINRSEERTQRTAVLLKDVSYVIEAHIEMIGEYDRQRQFGLECMAKRRIRKGQCFHAPFMGCSGYPAHFALYDKPVIKTAYEGEMDLGFMVYDVDYSEPENVQPMFYRALMKDGVIDVARSQVIKICRTAGHYPERR